MRYKKELGQNFLVDQGVIEDLLRTADIKSGDLILEIGAGTGAVTRALAEKARKVIAVEIDKDLIPELKANLEGLENVEIVNEDILKLDTSHQLLATSFKVIGSIPYQITSPLLHKLLKETPRPKSITIVVQKEVAEKIAAKPPKGTYLSNFVANFGRAEIIRTIKPDSFRPQPKVDSALLHIVLKPHPSRLQPEELEKFLHHGFAQPRKMLNKRFPAETLKKVGIDPKRRAQTLKFDKWVKLFKRFKGGGASSKPIPSPLPPNSA